MADLLAQLFSSEALVKTMRLFLMNPEEVFDAKEISKKIKTNVRKVNYELALLKRVGFIKQGKKEIEVIQSSGKGKNKKTKLKKVRGWILNPSFAFLNQLRSLILNSAPIDRDVLLKKFKTLGQKLKFVSLSGVFLDDESARIDVLVVGDSISRKKLEGILSVIEANAGKELKYALFATEEFLYRMSMFDHFLREVFDKPHEKLLDKLNV